MGNSNSLPEYKTIFVYTPYTVMQCDETYQYTGRIWKVVSKNDHQVQFEECYSTGFSLAIETVLYSEGNMLRHEVII